jgi:predicted ATPase/DNA-binding winged helix-turn-helix (wHTH) protein
LRLAGRSMDGHAISFGPFRLLAAQRLLLEGDRPVRLGSRAFDILTTLVERAGEVVSRDELIARAWPQTFVEESNLKIQVSALRRALGDGQGGHRYVLTVPGRGYNFVAPIALREGPQALVPATVPAAAAAHNLPLAITRMIGREDAVAAIKSRLSRERLVTVVGAGGIGKTTLALAVAEQMVSAYEHGVWLVDLAPLSHPRLVASTVAAVLDLEIHAEDPHPALSSALRDRRLLLLLDNCEHVIEEVANLAQALLSGARNVSILATSREPLRVAGEREHRLGPLSLPQPSSGLKAAEAAAFPAVQLFVERVAAVLEEFALTDANAPLIGDICRRLDGLPLAIEFAAPRVEVFGVEGVAAHLDATLPTLGARRRASAMPRHRTMRAVVDWSYGLLSENEKQFFRALCIFIGGFTVEAAATVVTMPATTPLNAIDRLADLVAKSLIVTDVSGANPRFRLLDTTRVYALEKLDESGDYEEVARRHAEYYRQLVERPEGKTARPGAEWLADCALEIDNVRAALDWSFSSSAYPNIGIEIAAAYVPVWMNLSLVTECRQRCERALRRLEAEQISDDRLQMLLRIGLGNSLIHTRGPSEQAQTILTEALTIADTLGDFDAQLRVLLVLSSVNVYRGEYARGAAEVERAAQIAHRIGDMSGATVAERRMGTTLLTMGRLSEAQRYLERAIRSAFHLGDERSTVRQRSGDHAMGRAMLARALWLRGFSDAARREAQASLDEVVSDLGRCRVIYYGIGRIAPMTGDFEAAEHAVSNLIELATRVNASFWMTAGQFLRGKLLVERRAFAEGLAVLRDAFEICRQTGWRLSYPEFNGSVALALAGLGQLDEAYDAVTDAIVSAGGSEKGQRWYVPELLRLKAQILLQQDTQGGVLAAESCLDQAAAMAREQDALFWELRIALSLCLLRQTQGRSDAGRQELGSVYDRFTEGFDTADAIAAKRLLDDLRGADLK